MQIRRIARYLWSAAIVLAAFCRGIAPAGAVGVLQGTNLLNNPGFEGEYSMWWDGPTPYMTAQMAPGWTPWWRHQSPDDPGWRYRMPEYKGAAPWQNRIRSGGNAQQWFTFYGTHIGGIYQRVEGIAPGSRLRFSIWVQVWSSAYDDPTVSNSPGDVRIQVGIDPTGGTDGFASTVIWSDAGYSYDEFNLFSVEATASADAVTVFVRTEPQFPVKHNDIYVDDASLIIVEGSTMPTDAPAPTSVPPTGWPSTPTPEATVTPTYTAAPSPVPTETTPLPPAHVSHTVAAGETLWGIARQYGTTVDAIVQANGLTDPDRLSIGQQLLIPVPATPTSTPPPQQPTPTQPAVQPTARPGGGGGGPGGFTTYVVQRGDNLFRIALRYNMTAQALAQLNGIVNPDLIHVGQVLTVPASPEAVAELEPTIGVPTTTTARIYVVQRGDNAFRIALRHGITLDALVRANNLANPALIYPGQELIIP